MVIKELTGKNIREYREQIGWTREKLAVGCKLNYNYLGYVERGERTISVENLEKIAKTLGVATWKLIYPHAPKEFPLKSKN
jgi:transcriptional regulator with XRE-family HTH domain